MDKRRAISLKLKIVKAADKDDKRSSVYVMIFTTCPAGMPMAMTFKGITSGGMLRTAISSPFTSRHFFLPAIHEILPGVPFEE